MRKGILDKWSKKGNFIRNGQKPATSADNFQKTEVY